MSNMKTLSGHTNPFITSEGDLKIKTVLLIHLTLNGNKFHISFHMAIYRKKIPDGRQGFCNEKIST